VLRNGKTLTAHSQTVKGEPENPVTDEELERKFRSLGGSVWGDALASEILEGCMKLETIDNYREYAADLPF
jgi:hypothetical protein